MAVCGYTRDAIARVFSLPDGDLLHVLKCVPDGARVGFYGGQVTTGNPRTKAIPVNCHIWPFSCMAVFMGKGPYICMAFYSRKKAFISGIYFNDVAF